MDVEGSLVSNGTLLMPISTPQVMLRFDWVSKSNLQKQTWSSIAILILCLGSAMMLSNKIDFSCCALWDSFCKSDHIPADSYIHS